MGSVTRYTLARMYFRVKLIKSLFVQFNYNYKLYFPIASRWSVRLATSHVLYMACPDTIMAAPEYRQQKGNKKRAFFSSVDNLASTVLPTESHGNWIIVGSAAAIANLIAILLLLLFKIWRNNRQSAMQTSLSSSRTTCVTADTDDGDTLAMIPRANGTD